MTEPSQFSVVSTDDRDWSVGTVRWIFGSAVLFSAILWTFGPLFLVPNYRLDTVEMIVISQQWVLSAYKHPALQCWVLRVLDVLTGDAEWTPYGASQIAVVLSVWGIWKIAEKMFSRKVAVAVAVAMLGYYFFNYESIVYNNKTFFRMFWILASYSLLLAVDANRLRYWILCGLFLAGGLYCNFLTLLLVLTILAYMVVDGNARKYWKTPGPYFSTGVCLLLFLPLVVWTVAHGFPQYTYAVHSIQEGETSRLYYPVRFLLFQTTFWISIVIPLLPMVGFHWHWKRGDWWRTTGQRMTTFFVLFPLLVMELILLYTGNRIRTEMGCHLWVFFLPFVLNCVHYRSDDIACRRAVTLGFANIVFIFALSAVILCLGPKFHPKKQSRHLFPGKALTSHVMREWSRHTEEPLRFVRGDHWASGCVVAYSPSSTQLWSTIWSDEDTFQKTGGMLLWIEPCPETGERSFLLTDWYGKDCFYTEGQDEPTEWLKKFPQAEMLPDVTLPCSSRYPLPPVKIGMAYVPPEKSKRGPSPSSP